ncbi:MAG: hypothetical protein F9K25_00400 [Candidatus Contendobacter sp.]|nr:MAG: hypothetical protein F9K25_00400 [Candidatus Contendobacter sp.]
MKVNVTVEATAQEMREFLGLPNVQPLHDDILKTMRDSVKRGVINLEALNMFKPLLPAPFHSMEMVQKFWEAVAKASGQPSKETVARKADDFLETPEHGGTDGDVEK